MYCIVIIIIINDGSVSVFPSFRSCQPRLVHLSAPGGPARLPGKDCKQLGAQNKNKFRAGHFQYF